MAGELTVYDVMVGIMSQPSILDDVQMVDAHGEPVLPKLPIFVINETGTHWRCCWYNVRQWSPVFDADPTVRELFIVQGMVWTGLDFAEELGDGAG